MPIAIVHSTAPRTLPRLQHTTIEGVLHLLDPIEVLRVGTSGGAGFLLERPLLLLCEGAGGRLFLDVRKVGRSCGGSPYILNEMASFLPCDAHCGRWVSFI